MVNSIVSIFITALVVTAIGIALRPNAPTAKVISATLGGFAGIQKAAAAA